MSSTPKHAPKHRATSARKAPRAALRTTLALTAAAVVVTGFAVGAGGLSITGERGAGTEPPAAADVATAVADTSDPSAETASTTRSEIVSRSDRRKETDPLKATALAVDAGNAMTRSEDFSDEDPRLIARALLAEYGFGESQFGCLDSLWERESHWNPLAANPHSGAYGIPQSLPGSKMATVAPDWRTNPITQIRWGLGYIRDRYGSPCGAWGHSERHGWY